VSNEYAASIGFFQTQIEKDSAGLHYLFAC
jgi:hypothetical protein